MHPVTVALTEDDAVAAQRLYGTSFLLRRSTLLRFGAMWLFLLIALIAISLGTDGAGTIPFIGIIILIAVLPICIIVGITLIQGPRAARQAFAAQKTLRAPVDYSWSPEGLSFSSEYGENLVPWAHLHSWLENDKIILLFEGPRIYRMLPKRLLSADQLVQLREYLASSGIAH
ncbi:hypothetical protein FF80_02823 [Devosia sp. LC5]|uniref:YcxB family protein n=1 Tax=Devosia sp. LC5 TaxID=1502724 RepID=UPI0004E2DF86|nr:YcxB family protein [Devosia sp. LC5]KFC65416.1 hypothetical protein FF80_02823 [Devosia sp. LC5]